MAARFDAEAAMKLTVSIASVALIVGLFLGPFATEAQSAEKVFRIGMLQVQSAPPPDARIPVVEALRERFRELGYVEGKHYSLEARWAGGSYDRLPEAAAALVQARVDVIFTVGNKVARVARDTTDRVPIVSVSCDPYGFVTTLARHGQNLTGITCMTTELSAKRMEIFKEAVPKVARVAFLYNPTDGGGPEGLELAKAAASKLNVIVIPVPVVSSVDLEPALASLGSHRPDGLFVHPDVLLFRHRQRIAEFALDQRLPSIDPFAEFVQAGGLMSYGASIKELGRRAAEQMDKIFKGARAGDLPVEQATKFYLTLNLKTAKALRLTITGPILLRVDQLIE